MRPRLRQALTTRLQKVFWIYWTNNFIITNSGDFKLFGPSTEYAFIPITLENHFRVRDFREESRVSEYREKLAREETGFFAEVGGKTAGSIWATVNKTQAPTVVRKYMRLLPTEALVHDIVTGEKFRGMGIGPFMVAKIAAALLDNYRVSRIIIDVNVKNRPSLRMMDKAGVPMNQQALYISAFGKLVFQKSLKQYL